MNKSGRNKIKQRSAVSRKLLMQYVISIIGYVVGVMLFVFCGVEILYDVHLAAG